MNTVYFSLYLITCIHFTIPANISIFNNTSICNVLSLAYDVIIIVTLFLLTFIICPHEYCIALYSDFVKTRKYRS